MKCLIIKVMFIEVPPLCLNKKKKKKKGTWWKGPNFNKKVLVSKSLLLSREKKFLSLIFFHPFYQKFALNQKLKKNAIKLYYSISKAFN